MLIHTLGSTLPILFFTSASSLVVSVLYMKLNDSSHKTGAKKFGVKVQPKSFVGMQLNFAGEGLMIKGKNGSLRMVLLKK